MDRNRIFTRPTAARRVWSIFEEFRLFVCLEIFYRIFARRTDIQTHRKLFVPSVFSTIEWSENKVEENGVGFKSPDIKIPFIRICFQWFLVHLMITVFFLIFATSSTLGSFFLHFLHQWKIQRGVRWLHFFDSASRSWRKRVGQTNTQTRGIPQM